LTPFIFLSVSGVQNSQKVSVSGDADARNRPPFKARGGYKEATREARKTIGQPDNADLK
jgi:hypothetical protein